jgi:hypothetical protein
MYEQAAKNSMESICEGLCRLVASVGEHNADLIISMQARGSLSSSPLVL